MAAEASGKIGVAEIVRIRTPCDFPFRKYVSVVDRNDLAGGLAYVVRALGRGNRAELLIEAHQRFRDRARSLLVARVIRLQQFDRFFLDEWQCGRDAAKPHGSIYRALRKFKGMRGAVVAVDALHLKTGQAGNGCSRSTILEKRVGLAGRTVAILDPRDALTLRVFGRVADLDSHAHMLSVNAAQVSAASKHHQRRLGLGVGGIVLEVENHTELDGVEFRRPMALFAGIREGTRRLLSMAEAMG